MYLAHALLMALRLPLGGSNGIPVRYAVSLLSIALAVQTQSWRRTSSTSSPITLFGRIQKRERHTQHTPQVGVFPTCPVSRRSRHHIVSMLYVVPPILTVAPAAGYDTLIYPHGHSGILSIACHLPFRSALSCSPTVLYSKIQINDWLLLDNRQIDFYTFEWCIPGLLY